MLSKYKKYTESGLQFLGKKLSWLNPNIITIIGIIPQLLFFYFMQSHCYWWAGLMLILSPIDMLDGIVARANNKVTAFGGFLDSTIDRVGDFLIIAGLYVGGLIPLSLAAGLLLATFLISYVRSRAELASDKNIKFDYGIIERPERIIYILIVVLLYAAFPNSSIATVPLSQLLIAVLLMLSIITLGQRVYFAYKKL